jgi:ribosomal protein S20
MKITKENMKGYVPSMKQNRKKSRNTKIKHIIHNSTTSNRVHQNNTTTKSEQQAKTNISNIIKLIRNKQQSVTDAIKKGIIHKNTTTDHFAHISRYQDTLSAIAKKYNKTILPENKPFNRL